MAWIYIKEKFKKIEQAVLLSLGALAITGYHAFIGVDLTHYPPEQVIFTKTEIRGTTYIDVVIPIIYWNDGKKGHDGLIFKEKLSLIGKKHFINFTSLNFVNPTLKNNRFSLENKDSFLAFMVPGESIKSHYTQFANDPNEGFGRFNIENFNDFVNNNKVIEVLWSYTTENEIESDTVSCYIDTYGVLKLFKDKNKDYISIPCKP